MPSPSHPATTALRKTAPVPFSRETPPWSDVLAALHSPGCGTGRLSAVAAPLLQRGQAAVLLPAPRRLLWGDVGEIQPVCGGVGWESLLFLPSSSTWRTHFLHAPNGWLAPRLCPGTKAAFMLWMPGF